jgi:ribosomal protein S18 acetylase RimI-like enzyme
MNHRPGAEVVYQHHNAVEARDLVSQMADLYASVFVEAPYHEGPEQIASFRRWIVDELAKPGFVLICAVGDSDLVGVAYGYTMAPGEWWRNVTLEPPEYIRGAAKFAIMEWMVRGEYRRAGVGRRLLDQLLLDRPEQYATLNVNPASLARELYRRWGWTQCGGTRSKNYPPMDVLVLDPTGTLS